MKIEGFCWNNILNTEARLLKVKIRGASVNDVGSMSLMPFNHVLSSKYITAILNSNIIFDFYREFINCSVNIQINDIKSLPIVIPDDRMLKYIETLVNKAIICRKCADSPCKLDKTSNSLAEVEHELDLLVKSLYKV